MYTVSETLNPHWLRYGPKKLPDTVSGYLRRRYSYLQEYLDTLRCFIDRTEYHGRAVNHILIYDPYRARLRQRVILTRSDLDKYSEMVAFEGYYDKSGLALINDRRQPIY